MQTEKTTEELIRQNKRYRETLIIIVSVIFGFLGGLVFDTVRQGKSLSQSAQLGGIVVDKTPYTMVPMTRNAVVPNGTFADAAGITKDGKEKK